MLFTIASLRRRTQPSASTGQMVLNCRDRGVSRKLDIVPKGDYVTAVTARIPGPAVETMNSVDRMIDALWSRHLP